MQLKKEFIIHESDGKQILIDTAGTFSGLVRCNKTAAFIVDCLKENTTYERIVATICEKYDVKQDIVEKDVTEIIKKLQEIGALSE